MITVDAQVLLLSFILNLYQVNSFAIVPDVVKETNAFKLSDRL